MSVAAARLPIAGAVVVTTALTFLIGERLRNYWHGFLAGLIYLTSAGTFLLGRIIMPEPVLSAFIAGGVFCAICGYQSRNQRAFWYAGFWICAAFACLTKSVAGPFYLLAIIGLLCACYRQARQRFGLLFRWYYLLLFLVLVAPWYLWTHHYYPQLFHRLLIDDWRGRIFGDADDVPRLQFLTLHLAWWFPWSLFLLPGLVIGWQRVFRWREIEFAEAVPLLWMARDLDPGSPYRTAAGLLLHGHVEWIRPLGSDCVGTHVTRIADGRSNPDCNGRRLVRGSDPVEHTNPIE